MIELKATNAGGVVTASVDSEFNNEHAPFNVKPASYQRVIENKLNGTMGLNGRLIIDNEASAIDLKKLLKEWGYTVVMSESESAQSEAGVID